MLTPLNFLKKAVELGKIPHALLFYGQGEEEKIAVAMEFVKLLNGAKSLEGVRPDLAIVEPLLSQDDSEEEEIKIAQIRELHSKLALKSYSSPFKVAIIKKAHYLNEEAQSALLKLLEEPKGRTIFILITEYPEILLPTILSRVERLRFSGSLKLEPAAGEDISKIFKSALDKRFQYAKELSEDPKNLKKNLEAWMAYFREKLLADPNQPQLVKILKNIQSTHYLISTSNVNRRLALEILMLEL